jgi:hypothetical protein
MAGASRAGRCLAQDTAFLPCHAINIQCIRLRILRLYRAKDKLSKLFMLPIGKVFNNYNHFLFSFNALRYLLKLPFRNNSFSLPIRLFRFNRSAKRGLNQRRGETPRRLRRPSVGGFF